MPARRRVAVVGLFPVGSDFDFEVEFEAGHPPTELEPCPQGRGQAMRAVERVHEWQGHPVAQVEVETVMGSAGWMSEGAKQQEAVAAEGEGVHGAQAGGGQGGGGDGGAVMEDIQQ